MFVFFVVFLLVPVILVFWWSTQEGGLTTGSEFVGLDNFRRLPRQVDAAIAISNTLRFALMSIPVTLVLALGVAHAPGSRRARGRGLPLPRLFPGAGAGRGGRAHLDLPHERRLRSVQHASCASVGFDPVDLARTEVRVAGAGGPRRLAQRRLLGDLLPGRDHRSAAGALPGGGAGWRQQPGSASAG